MARKTKPVEPTPIPVPAVIEKKELVLEGDPQAQLEFAHKAAKALMNWVEQKPKKVMIRGEQFLEFGDWQIIGRFYGATVGIEWSRGIEKGWEARAVVYRNGVVISSAEAMCTRDEKNWKDRDEFMLKSMAQTRASAKALRQAFGWVAELAGLRSTPAEEMGEQYDRSPVPANVVPTVTYDNPEDDGPSAKGNQPWKKADTQKLDTDGQKRIIKELLDSQSLVELETKVDYEGAALQITGFKLEVENYSEIISRLQALKKK